MLNNFGSRSDKFINLPEQFIDDSLKDIYIEKKYADQLKELLQNKSNSTKEANPLKKRQKVVNFLLQRGFESNLIWDYMDSYN